jgi:hypothetical protein
MTEQEHMENNELEEFGIQTPLRLGLLTSSS